MDEVQLMDVGLATSAQLQAYFDEDAAKGFRPRHTWWMSATLQPEWLRSVDTEPSFAEWSADQAAVPSTQRKRCLGADGKSVLLEKIEEAKPFAEQIHRAHQQLEDTGYGRITLVVCNTVSRACETARELATVAAGTEIRLIHSRFRPAERVEWQKAFLRREACVRGASRIIVATQVVEAGVDMSAGCLVTELAPWPNLVQRFGRCARYGGSGRCIVIDRGRDERAALPYQASELDAAWHALERIRAADADVGTAHLEEFQEGLTKGELQTLFPYDPPHLLLRREFEELFDTTPDLTGADLDVSRFIRSSNERDLLVFWRDIPKPTKAAPRSAPDRRLRAQRAELCPVPFLRARDWLCGPEAGAARKPRLRPAMRAWIWDWVDGSWVVAERASLAPGRVVLVASDCGGYRSAIGFDPDSSDPVPSAPLAPLAHATEAEAETDESDGSDELSTATAWKTIGCHGGEVAGLAERIGVALRLPQDTLRVLRLGGTWHDVGKAHPAFQGAIRPPGNRPDRQDLAKAPEEAFLKPWGNYRTSDDRDRRPGLRHELASALALFAVLERYQPDHEALLGPWIETFRLTGRDSSTIPVAADPTPCERALLACSGMEFDLLAYLVACHHGKVRVALHSGPRDEDYPDSGDGRGLPIRGVREGDVLPPVELGGPGSSLPALPLTLAPASLGLSTRTGRSWRERTIDLTERFGPGALAWLEGLLIAADRRASRLPTPDPALPMKGEPT
jgi:CRISPR-associated endonuclease/helicase Cas3